MASIIEEKKESKLYVLLDGCDNCKKNLVEGELLQRIMINDKLFCDECIEMEEGKKLDGKEMFIINYFGNEDIYLYEEAEEIKELFDMIDKQKSEMQNEMKFEQAPDTCDVCEEKRDNMQKIMYLCIDHFNCCKKCFHNYPDKKVMINIYGHQIVCHNNDLVKAFENIV